MLVNDAGLSHLQIALPHGSSLEPAEREVRMMEGTVDRKERRRNVFDADSGLRWLEEERETSLLGRRDRKKEGERDVDNRKIDRRSDNVSARDNTDSRAPPTSERWNDGSTRSLGNEGRRDVKWSTRWGPDDKEKDSRSEKKVDAEKDEAHAEKQTFTGRLLSESDSRDKWRPRHRQETHSVGTATYRAAPGFGSEKGRGKDKDSSNVGFAPGRGRGNPSSVASFSRPSSAGPIGARAVHGKYAKTAANFRYPRGKLLDIYRQKKMMSSFEDAKLEEIPSITLSTAAKPLAFVTPDTVEEVNLGTALCYVYYLSLFIGYLSSLVLYRLFWKILERVKLLAVREAVQLEAKKRGQKNLKVIYCMMLILASTLLMVKCKCYCLLHGFICIVYVF